MDTPPFTLTTTPPFQLMDLLSFAVVFWNQFL